MEALLVMDTWKILSANTQWKAEFIFREANRAADLLANLAFSFRIETLWIDEGPYQVLNTILKDKYCNSDT